MKNLTKPWLRLNLKQKILTTAILLSLILTLIITSVVCIILPNVYYNEKCSSLNKTINTLQQEIQGKKPEEAVEMVSRFSKGYEGCVRLKSPENIIVYQDNDLQEKLIPFSGIRRVRESISVNREVILKGKQKPYELALVLFINPIMEFRILLKYLLPTVVLILIILGIISSTIFSKLITRPLIEVLNIRYHQINKKKEFIAAVSHDLKTPITIISGQLEGMIYNVGKYKDRDLYLKKCYEHTRDLKYLVDKLMEVSKKDFLDLKLVKNEINIEKLTKDVLKKHKFLYEKKKLKVIEEYNTNSTINANKEDMVMVISNLLSNAIKYSPEGETIYINIREDKKRFSFKTVVFSIENTGITLREDQLKKVFDPLYRGECSRNKDTGGTGLGLYFVSNALSKHGFSYKMFSKENSIVFTINFSPYNI